MIDDSVFDYLEQIADENGIDIFYDYDGSEATTACSLPKNKRIYVNMNYYRPNAIMFQLAHEIGHILCGHEERSILYFTPSKAGIELEATQKAIDLLIPFYTYEVEMEQINITTFMDTFGIPGWLEDVVRKRLDAFIQENM